MGIGATTGFANISTTSPGKLKVIQQQVSLVQNVYNNLKFNGLAIGLPGDGSQLERHIEEYEDCGVKEPNQIMVDIDPNVYQTLLSKATQIGFKGKVIKDDICNVVRQEWKDGNQVDVIDFDDVSYLDYHHIALLDEACRNDVKVFNLVLSTRGNRGGPTDCMLYWAKKLKITRYRHSRGNMAYRYRDIQAKAVEYVANSLGYNCVSYPYRGRGHHTLVSCVVTKV